MTEVTLHTKSPGSSYSGLHTKTGWEQPFRSSRRRSSPPRDDPQSSEYGTCKTVKDQQSKDLMNKVDLTPITHPTPIWNARNDTDRERERERKGVRMREEERESARARERERERERETEARMRPALMHCRSTSGCSSSSYSSPRTL